MRIFTVASAIIRADKYVISSGYVNNKSCQKPGFDLITNNFSDLVGKYFALLLFDKASKQLVSQFVAQVQASMQENLKLVEWLDGPTRRAAIEKLSDMTNLIGYSTLSKHFPYKLRGDAPLADNIRVIMEHQYNEYIGRVGGSVNRNEWVTTGSSVDAAYIR